PYAHGRILQRCARCHRAGQPEERCEACLLLRTGCESDVSGLGAALQHGRAADACAAAARQGQGGGRRAGRGALDPRTSCPWCRTYAPSASRIVSDCSWSENTPRARTGASRACCNWRSCICPPRSKTSTSVRSEEHTSELQSRENLVCRLLLEKKNNKQK